jgi:hypothetical protein
MNFKKLTSTLLLATTVMTGTFLTTIKLDKDLVHSQNPNTNNISLEVGGEKAVAGWDPIAWAVVSTKAYVRRTAIGAVAGWVKDCAFSTTCLPGQDISMVVVSIPANDVYNWVGECFNPWSESAKWANKKVAVRLTRESGVPVIYSYYDWRKNTFVFGVPK